MFYTRYEAPTVFETPLNVKDFERGNANSDTSFIQSNCHAGWSSPEIFRNANLGDSTRRRPIADLLCTSSLSSIADNHQSGLVETIEPTPVANPNVGPARGEQIRHVGASSTPQEEAEVLSNMRSPGSNDFDRISHNPFGTTPGPNFSHLPSFDARNGSRDLTDPATAYDLNYAVNISEEFTDPATADNLCFTVGRPDEIIDPATAGALGYAVTGPEGLVDLAIVEILNDATDRHVDSLLCPDLETVEQIRSIDQSMASCLQWTVSGSNALTDPSIEEIFRGATSDPNQMHRNEDLAPFYPLDS
jgi:hypothetical protein